MLERPPTKEELTNLIGKSLLDVWQALCNLVERKYEMEQLWNSGGKAWTYEYKYRRGGKTLCALYAKESCIGFMVILGKYEREKFEADRDDYTAALQKLYDESTTYHDGKWIMLEPKDKSYFADIERLLFIKRKPNKKL